MPAMRRDADEREEQRIAEMLDHDREHERQRAELDAELAARARALRAREDRRNARLAAGLVPEKRGGMTAARKAVEAVGLKLEGTGWDDYRVFWPEDADEAGRGYFTDDLEDAVGTARAMAAERARRKREGST